MFTHGLDHVDEETTERASSLLARSFTGLPDSVSYAEYSNSTIRPNRIDAGASRDGKPVFVLERMQINHSTEVDVPHAGEAGSLPSSSRKSQ
jgi:hypothetical protein